MSREEEKKWKEKEERKREREREKKKGIKEQNHSVPKACPKTPHFLS